MDGYELTSRGKILVSIILVVLFLLTPSTILFFKSGALKPKQPPDEENRQAYETPTLSPDVTSPGFNTESPSPTDTGNYITPEYTPDNTPPNGGGIPDIDETQNGQDPPGPPSGFQSVDVEEGIMTFIFSPGNQSSLDEETIHRIADFLHSPKNTPYTYIELLSPALSLNAGNLLMSAVHQAFELNGVTSEQIVHYQTDKEPDGESFLVSLTFRVAVDK